MEKKYTLAKIEKEKIWSELNLSGSKFKEWCLNPQDFVKNEKKEFPDLVLEKMKIGSQIENFIFELTKSKWNDHNFLIDKRTFQRIDYNFCFANIDGKCFENQDDSKNWNPIEIKNSELDLEQCLENYKYQLLYYCWFFNKKEIIFITFTKGWKLRIKRVTFSDEDLIFCEKKVLDFKRFLLDGTIPNSEELTIEKVDDEKLKEAFEKVIKLYDIVNENSKKLDEAKDYLKKFGNFENINYNGFNFKISESTSNLFKKDLALKKFQELNIDTLDFFSESKSKKLLIKRIDE